MKQQLIEQLERDIENIRELRKIGLYSRHDVYILTKYARKIIKLILEMEKKMLERVIG